MNTPALPGLMITGYITVCQEIISVYILIITCISAYQCVTIRTSLSPLVSSLHSTSIWLCVTASSNTPTLVAALTHYCIAMTHRRDTTLSADSGDDEGRGVQVVREVLSGHGRQLRRCCLQVRGPRLRGTLCRCG